MKFNNLENKSEKISRRLTGVKKATFNKIIEILGEAYAEKHKKRGAT